VKSKYKIPVYQTDLSGNEKFYVNQALESSWISSKGEFIERFERGFSEYVGVTQAISVCNGTVALHLAMLALGIGPTDEVIVPTLTYVAPVNAIRYVGATPVFVDSHQKSWQIDVSEVERAITHKTRAIIAVHLYGQACDMVALKEIARKHRVFLVEDCSEAFGTTHACRHVGSFGDIGTFSFFGNKTITTGEGGMVITNDKTLFERAKRFKGQGLAAYREYWHDIIGHNFRMTNIAAAIGVAQLERAESIINLKRNLGKKYRSLMVGLPIEFHDPVENGDHTHWMVSILVKTNDERDALRWHLANCGVETRPVFYPVHTMPMYSSSFQRFPIAEDIAWRGINLPSYHHISDDDLNYVSDSMRSFFS
jgi:perosamine synthetase